MATIIGDNLSVALVGRDGLGERWGDNARERSGKEGEGIWGPRAMGVQRRLQELGACYRAGWKAPQGGLGGRGAVPVLSAWRETSSAGTWVRKLFHTVDRRVRTIRLRSPEPRK